MAYIDLTGMKPVKKHWTKVKEGDVLKLGPYHTKMDARELGLKIRNVTVGESKRCGIVGQGGNITIHFGCGTQPISYPEAYEQDKNVFITVYEAVNQ